MTPEGLVIERDIDATFEHKIGTNYQTVCLNDVPLMPLMVSRGQAHIDI
jgi:hypothetical protein